MLSILLIDDNQTLLKELEDELRAELTNDEVEIKTWVPSKDDDPSQKFQELVTDETILVVTDYDLTRQGQTGLFGSSIVGWCQQKYIPVGDFSRGNPGNLPKEPNLFELRVPTNENAAHFVASVFKGFRDIRQAIANKPSVLETRRSPAALLAELLNVRELESQFSQYAVRVGATNASILEKVMSTAPENKSPTEQDKKTLLGYIAGHLLLNAVLRYPGPILSLRALSAYIATDETDKEKLQTFFEATKYDGPFSGLEDYFWLSKVDDLLDQESSKLDEKFSASTQGELNRAILEKSLDVVLTRHDCKRCDGLAGGFLCPFTSRTVCQRSDCSIGASSWIPQGARLSRIERDFYDEWAPILGI
ncbi:hypothetical protein ACO0LD_09165 [Undibacterium sp. Ji83W]|uniref:hypothetical protein n=1 Tax=Undibacterium sp. Ji83W TaxID=3413043 RepID=UPI003BF23A47